MNFDLKFYLALLLRRLPVMTALFVCCLAVGLGIAYTLPPRYVSDAQLLVQSAQIEGSTIRADATERIEVTRQQILTRATLIDIARKYGVFNGQSGMSPDEIVSEMRLRTSINIRSGNRGQGATFLNISFTDENAQTAANVANELVTLFLAEDAGWRKETAGETLDFYQDEVDRISLDLSRKSSEIVTYEEANKDALPSGNDFRLGRQSQLQEAISIAARNRAALDEQRSNLIALGRVGGAGQPNESQEMRQLRQAEANLADALSRFSESNPRVKILRNQVERLREAVNASIEIPQDADARLSDDPAAAAIQLQIASIDSQINFLDADVEQARAELETINEAIRNTPQVAIRLDELNREYENLQRQYNAALSALNAAQAGEKIELASKGERLRVIEQAVAPSEPNSPNRKKIAAAGAGAGFALAAGFFILAELLTRVIRRPSDIVTGLGIQPFATIPYLETTTSKNRRRALWTILIAILAVGIPAGLWAIHEYYLPLDYILDRIVDRLSL